MLLGVISALAWNQPEGGPQPPRPPHARPCRRGRAAPSRRGPYASKNKIHLPRSPEKRPSSCRSAVWSARFGLRWTAWGCV